MEEISKRQKLTQQLKDLNQSNEMMLGLCLGLGIAAVSSVGMLTGGAVGSLAGLLVYFATHAGRTEEV